MSSARIASWRVRISARGGELHVQIVGDRGSASAGRQSRCYVASCSREPRDRYCFRTGSSVSVYDKLTGLGISLLPVTPSPRCSFRSCAPGTSILVSGHIARQDGQPWVGQLGAELSTAQGQSQAARATWRDRAPRRAAYRHLRPQHDHRIVELLVLVNSPPTFTEHTSSRTGASELLNEVFAYVGPSCSQRDWRCTAPARCVRRDRADRPRLRRKAVRRPR